MGHNLIHNIIPGAIALAIILGGIFWLVVDDIRRHSGRSPLRFRLPRPANSKPARSAAATRVSLDA